MFSSFPCSSNPRPLFASFGSFASFGPKPYLPKVSLPYDYDCDGEIQTFLYYTPDMDRKSYKELMSWMTEFIQSDAQAMTVNQEVLFNHYDKNVSFKERIQNEWFRKELSRSLHESILQHLFSYKNDSVIRIYMSEEYPWSMNVVFKPKMKCFQMSFSQTKEWMDYEHKIYLEEELDQIVKSRQEYYQNL
jgi:hypothetical protein